MRISVLGAGEMGEGMAVALAAAGVSQVYVANRGDGSNPVKVTTTPRSYAPSWAPDGAKIAYIYDPLPGG